MCCVPNSGIKCIMYIDHMEYEIEYEIGIDDIVIPSCACKYEAGGLAPELPVSPHSILS